MLLRNGEHAIPLLADSFDEYLDNNEYTFVNFVSHSSSLTKKERTDWMVEIKN